ncbi:TPA: hypothetical protein SMP78_003992 [Proteus mirabilis]
MSKFFGAFILILFFSLVAEAKQTITPNPAINKQKVRKGDSSLDERSEVIRILGAHIFNEYLNH